MKRKPLYPDLEVHRRQIQEVSAPSRRAPAQSRARVYEASEARERLLAIIEDIQQRGHFLPPSRDVRFSTEREIPVGNATVSVGGEAWNSALLFTAATALVDGYMLLHGKPGGSKTTLPTLMLSAIHGDTVGQVRRAVLQGDAEMNRYSLVAEPRIDRLMQGKRELLVRHWVKSPYRVLDEVNRLSQEAQGHLLSFFNDGKYLFEDLEIRMQPGPAYFTANPPDGGNNELLDALRDRMEVAIDVGAMNPYDTGIFLERRRGSMRQNLESIVYPVTLGRHGLERAKRDVARTKVPLEALTSALHFFAELDGCDMASTDIEKKSKSYLQRAPPAVCGECHHYEQPNRICAMTTNSVTPRTIAAIDRYARAVAYLRGHSEVGADDIEAVLPYATWFKLEPSSLAAEEEPRHESDRVGLVRELYGRAKRRRREITEAVPEYGRMLAASTELHGEALERGEALRFIEQAAQVDTPAKYPLIRSLQKMYGG